MHEVTNAEEVRVAQPVVHPASTGEPGTSGVSRWRRIGNYCGLAWRAAWKFLVGMLCTQNPLGSILLVGWTNRVTQRAVFKRWWKQSDLRRRGIIFDQFVSTLAQSPGHETWPNWILAQSVRGELVTARSVERGRILAVCRALFQSLWLNLKLGIQVLFNTLVVTLPGCVFMQFSWRYGWDNSFAKGYEQAFIGPATGLFGIFLFIAAMYYVPLALARQAATGDWKSFYDFRLIWRLIRRKPIGWLLIAVSFFLLVIPVQALKAAPTFFMSQDTPFAARIANMSPQEALQFLRAYFFWSAAYIFPAFVILRIIAARVYATAMLAEIRSGKTVPALSLSEHEALSKLGLLKREDATSPLIVRALGWTATRSAWITSLVLAAIVWFAFVSQNYVSEFVNYHAQFGQAWLNQPLVQLPYFRYIPDHLYEE